MLNYSLEAFYSPFLVSIYGPIMDFTAIVSTFCFIFITYLIIFQAQKIATYKWLLLNSIFWSYVADLFSSSILLVPFFPELAAYLHGVLAPYINALPALLILLGLYINKSFAVLINILYRRAQLWNTGRLYEFFKKPMNLFIFAVFIHLTFYGIIIMPFLFIKLEDSSESTSLDAPVLLPIYYEINQRNYCHPANVVCIWRLPSNDLNYNICLFLIIGLTLAHILAIYCIYDMHRAVKNLEKLALSASTKRLQRMLHRSCVIEVLVAVVFLTLPGEICMILLMFKVSYTGHLAIIIIILSTFQTLVNVMAQCYFITPFRRWILRKFRLNTESNHVGVIII